MKANEDWEWSNKRLRCDEYDDLRQLGEILTNLNISTWIINVNGHPVGTVEHWLVDRYNSLANRRHVGDPPMFRKFVV